MTPREECQALWELRGAIQRSSWTHFGWVEEGRQRRQAALDLIGAEPTFQPEKRSDVEAGKIDP